MPCAPTRLESLTEWGEALSAFRTRGEKGGGMVKLTNSLLDEIKELNSSDQSGKSRQSQGTNFKASV